MSARPTVEQSIEHLCHKGCRQVWRDIESLQKGEPLPETLGLSESEIEAVIRELKSIMAVYEGSCSPDVTS